MAELRRLRVLAQRCRDIGRRKGLEQLFFGAVPDLDGDPPVNRVRILYRLEPEFAMPDDLAELERAARQPSYDPEEAERKRRAAADEAAGMAKKLLNPEGGIL